MLITGLLALINAESPISIFNSTAAPCVVERPESPRDEPEPASASPGAQQPT